VFALFAPHLESQLPKLSISTTTQRVWRIVRRCAQCITTSKCPPDSPTVMTIATYVILAPAHRPATPRNLTESALLTDITTSTNAVQIPPPRQETSRLILDS
jgi:hypothetical protein